MTDDEREQRIKRAVHLTTTAAHFLAGLNTTSNGLSMNDIPEVTARTSFQLHELAEQALAPDIAHQQAAEFRKLADELEAEAETKTL